MNHKKTEKPSRQELRRFLRKGAEGFLNHVTEQAIAAGAKPTPLPRWERRARAKILADRHFSEMRQAEGVGGGQRG